MILQVQAKDYSVHWQQSQEHFIIDENSQAVLGKLAAGQTQELIFWLQSGESEEGVMEIKVQAYIQNEAEPVKKERVISTMIQPLKADFTVEKTADCILAGPDFLFLFLRYYTKGHDNIRFPLLLDFLFPG